MERRDAGQEHKRNVTVELIRQVMQDWYLALSQASVALTTTLKQTASSASLPSLTVLLFGLIGSLSPCQLSTNLSAAAYVSRRVDDGRPCLQALAYFFGKLAVYMLVGGAVILLGLQIQPAAVPMITGIKKVIGPLMITLGLGLLGVFRLNAPHGIGWSSWVQSRVIQGGETSAFVLGVVFSFAVCPTLFWLFFGLMIPLALISDWGWLFPALFALGATAPLLLFSGLLAIGADLGGHFLSRLGASGQRISRVSGAILILAGIHDTLVYWFI